MEEWKLVARVLRSQNKKRILTLLNEKGRPLTPTQIASDLEIHRNNVSEHLSFLREHDLVEVKNPDDPHHRLYAITDGGIEMLEKVE